MDTTTIKAAAREHGKTLHWIVYSIMSTRGRRLAFAALVLMLLSIFTTTGATYLLRFLVDALKENDVPTALCFLLLGVGPALVGQQLLLSVHDVVRERLWEENSSNIVTTLTRLYFDRTVAELSSTEDGVGTEQIESGKQFIRNLFHLIFFEVSSTAATLLCNLVLAFVIAPVAGMVICLLIVTNIIWFMWINGRLASPTERIDESYRRINARVVERGHFMLAVKTAGAETLITEQTRREALPVQKADRRTWADWYIPIDRFRSLGNILVTVITPCYGIWYAQWSLGEVVAMITCFFITIEKFGFVGHAMRQFTSQISRLKALRVALTADPAFDNNAGIIYERKD